MHYLVARLVTRVNILHLRGQMQPFLSGSLIYMASIDIVPHYAILGLLNINFMQKV